MRSWLIFALILLPALADDTKQEQQYSDRLRKLQREVKRLSDQFSAWCGSKGLAVGPKGIAGDLGCVIKPVTPPPQRPDGSDERSPK